MATEENPVESKEIDFKIGDKVIVLTGFAPNFLQLHGTVDSFFDESPDLVIVRKHNDKGYLVTDKEHIILESEWLVTQQSHVKRLE